MYPIRSAYPQQNLYTQVRVLLKNTWNTWSKLFVLWMIKHIQIFSYWDKIPILMWLPWVSLFVPYWLKSNFLRIPPQGAYYPQPVYAAQPHVIHHTTVVQPNSIPSTALYPAPVPVPSPRNNGMAAMGMVAGTTMAMSAGGLTLWDTCTCLLHPGYLFFSSALANHLKQI